MSRSSIQKKSTWIDMTPFVDVAFLILTFFILVTKFKPEEAVQVQTPSSVSSKELKEKDDTFLVLFDKDGAVHVQLSDNLRKPIIDNMNKAWNLGMSADELNAFKRSGAVSVPMKALKQYYSLPENQRADFGKAGIPMDSIGGELSTWVRDVNSYTQGKGQFYIKGDNTAKYPKFKEVLTALKKNEIFKFNLVTATEPIPSGSALDVSNSNLNKK